MHLYEQVRRFQARFAQGVGATLGEVVPAGLLGREAAGFQ